MAVKTSQVATLTAVVLLVWCQVRAFVQAAEEDEVGKYAEGAMERVLTASEHTLKIINASSSM